MTKLLMTADTVGGVWTYALDLCRALAGHGVDVALATMGALPAPDQQRDAALLPNVTLYCSDFALEWMPEPWEDVRRAGDWLLDLEQRLAPDVVHLNGYVHGALPWRAPCLVVGHSCVMSWWQAVKGKAAPRRYLQYSAAVKEGLRSADTVIAPTHAMLAALVRHYGPLGNGRVISNGRDTSLYRATGKEPFVLAAGRIWDEAKNIAALDAIADRLPWPVRVAGDAAPAGVGDSSRITRAQWLGRLTAHELAHELARAAIYALPARYEPFGLSALEAAMSGCALVLGDIDSLREVWDDAALYVPPGEPAALLNTLSRLIEDPSLRQKMAARALHRAQRYTLARMVDAYFSEYRRLTASTSHLAPLEASACAL